MTRTDLARLSDIVAGAGLEYTVLSPPVVVFNGSTTGASVSRTLTSALTGVPSDAVLVTGMLQMSVNATPNNGNWIGTFHENVNGEETSILRHFMPSGIVADIPFIAKVHQSSGSKIYYQISRAAGTITYYMRITGYWAPASV